jgi:hypothetical protein
VIVQTYAVTFVLELMGAHVVHVSGHVGVVTVEGGLVISESRPVVTIRIVTVISAHLDIVPIRVVLLHKRIK